MVAKWNNQKIVNHGKLGDTASANDTEYQPVAKTTVEGNEDVQGASHPGEAQLESAWGAISVPTKERVGGN